MKKVYVNETEDPKRRGRPVVRWMKRVKEYMHAIVSDRKDKESQVKSQDEMFK